ncbi:MAG: ATP-binding protein [Chitinophagaceae bacterium]
MLNAQDVRIVIIDDDEDDFFIIADYIKGIPGTHFIIDWCNNYQQAIQKINAREYQIYFIDYRLGSRTGLELLKEVNQNDFYDPVVLLTGKGNVDIDVRAMQSGATDYLIKSELTTEKLERCIRYSLNRADDLKELKARENKYRSLFENSKDAVFITDSNLVLTEVNHAASLLFLSDEKKMVNRPLLDFIKDNPQKIILSQLLSNKDNINDLAVEIENSNGELRSCLLSLSFIEDKGEHLTHGILHDITNIKKVELANLQAQKLAANERLMRTLAHEIRNPLNNILLSVDHFTLPYDESIESQKNLVAIMQRNGIRINHIITELLNLSKPLDLPFQKHTMQEILDESITLTQDRINLQKVIVRKNYPEFPFEISANKSKLVIAFTNILINAIEAMETGKGELSVSLTRSPNNYIVSIRDNGKGIPSEYMHKLFEPFFTMKKNGTGLGLPASYSIIQSHKGDIRVESQFGKGTEFIISLNTEN